MHGKGRCSQAADEPGGVAVSGDLDDGAYELATILCWQQEGTRYPGVKPEPLYEQMAPTIRNKYHRQATQIVEELTMTYGLRITAPTGGQEEDD